VFERPAAGTKGGVAVSDQVKYPEVRVQLEGEDGNAFAILGRVQKALRRAGVDDEEVQRFIREATSDDYDHLLATVMRWVEIW
jgi:hypothetical protein